MLRVLPLLALLGASVPVVASAQPTPKARAFAPKPKAQAIRLPKVETWTLANGMQVAFLPMENAPSVTVQVWYRVGSKDEAPDRRGSAHMFEHMMFKGTEHVRPEEHARYLSEIGGYINAFTTEDVTAYHNTLPADYLDFALKLEAERMRNLWFREDMIAKEKQVVKEEIRQQENSPIFTGFLKFLEMAYTVHPYSWTAGGALKDLEATSLSDLKKFYNTYYVPNNALLIVVGKANRAAVEASSKKWFAGIAKGATPPRPAASKVEPLQTEARRQVSDPGQIGILMRGYHIPAAAHPDMAALQVLARILVGGESSRMYEKVVRKGKLALETGGELLIRENPGIFLVFAAYLDGSKEAKLESGVQTELSRLRKSMVTAKELKKAKNQLMSQFVFGLENVTGIANQIGNSWINRGDATGFLQDLNAFEAVSAADIKRVANLYLKDEQANTVIVPPASAGVK